MKKTLVLLFAFSLTVWMNRIYTQDFRQSLLDQALEYYFVTGQYQQSMQVLDTLDQRYNLAGVNLDYAIKVSIQQNRTKITEKLIRVCIREFDYKDGLPVLESEIRDWLADSTFTFQHYFNKKWKSICSYNRSNQQYLQTINSRFHQEIAGFLAVDQFIRMNQVSKQTFIEIDSLNMDNFMGLLLEENFDTVPRSRYNQQIIQVLLRHIGPARFVKLEEARVFKKLTAVGMLSPVDYALMRDYIYPESIYFPAYDAFIEEDWAMSKIATREQLKETDRRRQEIGLLPLEYSAFCIRKKLIVPAVLKYALPLETIISLQ
jgi:hypothetical protein